MQIREYQESDLAALRAIHAAQGFDYALPDLGNPLFLTKLVLCEEAAATWNTRSIDPAGNSATNDSREVESGLKLKPAGQPASRKIIGAALLRLTAEAYLLLDPKAGTPRERWQWLLALHAAAERNAWQRGLEDVHAWLPPSIAKKFGKRIQQLGWVRDDMWTPYCKRLAAK